MDNHKYQIQGEQSEQKGHQNTGRFQRGKAEALETIEVAGVA